MRQNLCGVHARNHKHTTGTGTGTGTGTPQHSTVQHSTITAQHSLVRRISAKLSRDAPCSSRDHTLPSFTAIRSLAEQARCARWRRRRWPGLPPHAPPACVHGYTHTHARAQSGIDVLTHGPKRALVPDRGRASAGPWPGQCRVRPGQCRTVAGPVPGAAASFRSQQH